MKFEHCFCFVGKLNEEDRRDGDSKFKTLLFSTATASLFAQRSCVTSQNGLLISAFLNTTFCSLLNSRCSIFVAVPKGHFIVYTEDKICDPHVILEPTFILRICVPSQLQLGERMSSLISFLLDEMLMISID